MKKKNNEYNYINDCRHIYSSLVDEESKYIFNERLLYSLTGDDDHIKNVIKTTQEGCDFIKLVEKHDDIYIFGAGIWGQEVLKVYPNQWKGIIDNDSEKWGQELNGVKIFSPKEVINKGFSGKVLISSRLYHLEIYEQITKMGLLDDQIINFGRTIDELAVQQYFSIPEFPHDANEVFADIGSLDAKTALQFINWSGDFEKIYCFEPDQQNVPKCKKTMVEYLEVGKAEIIEKGAWSTDGILYFTSRGNGGSTLSDSGDEVAVTTIDSVFEKQNVTFIKMDIEGSELEALIGAETVICNQKPKLAICVYHRPEDIISIANLLLKYNPNYKFYLRHYSLVAAETVLYAFNE